MRYQGYTVQRTLDPWAISFGWEYEYFKDEEVFHSSTLEDALMDIEWRTGRSGWPVLTSEGSQNIFPFETLKDAIRFCDMFNAKPLFTFNAP